MRRLFVRAFSVVCLLSLLVGCSSTTFVYNRLDFLVPWYLDDYVDLSRAQKTRLDDLLDPFLKWHRASELPQYLEILALIERRLDQALDAKHIEEISLAMQNAWLRTESEGMEWMLQLGADLTEPQIEEFLENLNEKQEEFEEKYLERTEKEFRKDSYENLRDNLQDYIGRLDSEQKDRIRLTSEQLLRSDSVWLSERRVWLQTIATLLERKPGWQQGFKDVLASRDENHSEEYRQVYDHNIGLINQTLADVLNSRSDKQERRLRAKLADIQEDLNTLIAQAKR